MIRPTMKQLAYLSALTEERSFTGAAVRCGVTQSTLSAGIKELEHILGQTLVNKGRKDITLTAFGTEVAHQARDILAATDRIAARAQQNREPLSGPLRLGVIPTIAPYFLPQILPVLNQAFPALELHLHEDLSARLVEGLARGTLDVALMAFPYDTPGMTQMFLFEEPFYLACRAGRYTQTDHLSVHDVDADSLLLLEEGHCLREHALAACELQKPARRQAYSAISLHTIIQMVGHDYGVTLLPDMAATQSNLPPNVDVLRFQNPPMRRIGLAWRRGHPQRSDFALLGNAMINKHSFE